jgi:hypothetical protein
LKYKSLLNHLPGNQKKFDKVWSTHAAKQGIFFRTSKFLFQWDPNLKKITSWTSPYYFWNSFVHNGDILVNEKNKGLLKIVDGSLQLLPGMSGWCRDLAPVGDSILAASSEGVSRLKRISNETLLRA